MNVRPGETAPDGPVLLFDGICNLCHGAVRFVVRRDPRAHLRFASLRSTVGCALAEAHGVDARRVDTMVLLDDGRAYFRSAAALRVARHLEWPWPLAWGLVAVPRPLRDALYDFVGRRRFRWFGIRAHCVVAVPEEAHRFIE